MRASWTTSIWTDQDNITKLKAMWAADIHFDDIAIKLGVSGKSIVMKADRLGLPRRPHLSKARQRKPSIPKPIPAPTLGVQRALPVALICDGVLLEHRSGCCFPVGDTRPHRFCDTPGSIYGQSIYCDYHRRIMINPAYHSQGMRRAGRTDQNHAQ
jgi:hypothetical protein